MRSTAERFPELVAAVEAIAPSEHLCMSYGTAEEALAAIVPFVRRGLDQGDQCVLIANHGSSTTLLTALRAQGIPVDASLRSGALSVLGAAETYCIEGFFDPDGMLGWIQDRRRLARQAGFSGLRLVGDMICIAQKTYLDVGQLAGYEARLNDVLANQPVSALCIYDRRRFGPDVIREVIATHPVVVAGGTVCPNPFFVPPAEYLAPDWPEREIEWLLNTFTGMQRAQEKLGESEARYKTLSRRLLDLQETERRSVARDLHDHLGQLLTAIKLSLQGTARRDRKARKTSARAETNVPSNALAMIEDGIQEVRSIAAALRPPMLDDLGLAAALRWHVDRQARLGKLQSRLDVKAIAALRFPPPIELACFRLVQEAVTNVLRHAQARRLKLKVGIRDRSIEMMIRDDGVGFDVTAARKPAATGRSLGLLGMEERVAIANGRLTIESIPGQGTTIRVSIPVEGGVDTRRF